MKPAVYNVRLALDAAATAVRQAYDEALVLDDLVLMARLREIGTDIFHVNSHVVTTHVGQRTASVQEIRA